MRERLGKAGCREDMRKVVVVSHGITGRRILWKGMEKLGLFKHSIKYHWDNAELRKRAEKGPALQ